MSRTSRSLTIEFESITAALWFVPVGLLLVALLPLPYGYYVLLRLVVCGVAAFLAWKHFDATGRFGPWPLILAMVAVLFNPVIPVYLNRVIWAPIDLLSAMTLGIHYYAVRRGASRNTQSNNAKS
jgi:hypothetical protein